MATWGSGTPSLVRTVPDSVDCAQARGESRETKTKRRRRRIARLLIRRRLDAMEGWGGSGLPDILELLHARSLGLNASGQVSWLPGQRLASSLPRFPEWRRPHLDAFRR